MKALMLRCVTGLAVGAWLMISLSCARDQKLRVGSFDDRHTPVEQLWQWFVTGKR